MILRLITFLLFFLSIIENSNAQFSNLQGGANDPIRSFYSDSTNNLLYVVGRFTQIGSKNINQIAVWDGIEWNSFGNNDLFSSPHNLQCIVKFNNQIIVGGSFDSIGNTLVNNIAKWNGITWEPMGMGFDYHVLALYQYKGDLYAGGSFNYSGNKIVRALAKWNGQDWDTVGNFIGAVTSFEKYNNKLIIAGSFYQQTNPGDNIIGYDGANWDTTFSKFNNTIVRVRNINDTLYACGLFTSIPVNNSNYLSAFYENFWHSMPIPTGGQNTITDIVEYHNKKYVCGYFSNPPDICVFNGVGYDSLFNANGFIASLYVYDNKLFIAGQFFQTISGQNYNCIISYDDLIDGLENISDNNGTDLQIYPNPSSDGKINIILSKKEDAIIEVIRSDGKLIFQTTSNETFDIKLQAGFYIVKLITKYNKIISKKLIVL